MPLYEYRCTTCRAVSTVLEPAARAQAEITCEICSSSARRIVSRPSVHRDRSSKVARLDPRYDKLVDQQMARTQAAEPDRYLDRMKPLSED